VSQRRTRRGYVRGGEAVLLGDVSLVKLFFRDSRTENSPRPARDDVFHVVASPMPNRPEVLDHLGPYVQHGPIATCCELSERVWRTYNELTAGYIHSNQYSREYLILRMLYIAEITSTAIRLNATWALTPAAMSLLRDRYEQTVRFSWLVRNPDKTEFEKYERTKVAKINSIVRNLEPDTIKHFEAILGPTPAWATETPTKEDRTFLEAWNTLDLKSMALKRDAFPALADTVLAKKKLASSYEAIYRQFSSVSHYDRFSIELLGVQEFPDGKFVLGTRPHWHPLLVLQNAQFDIIQCFEAAHVCHKKDAAEIFNAYFTEWYWISKQVVG
jgi:hypothetical protein